MRQNGDDTVQSHLICAKRENASTLSTLFSANFADTKMGE